jgi:uncharacterized protein YdeI (YjbR/CyaY-like superfamily)
MNPKVDEFLRNAARWQTEMEALRAIALESGLTEELKWKQPCYTFQNTNVILISSFKENCVMSFLKGVLLADSAGILVSPGENSQSVRFAKFTHVKDILDNAAVLKAYIFEAIEVEKAGLKAPKPLSQDVVYCDELIQKLHDEPELKAAFEALTPGRKRAYNLFFSAAKQSATRISRIDSYKDRIFKGKGMNDCICGLSKRMPNCDGSHKQLAK